MSSVVESITFTRRPGSCGYGDGHGGYTIGWTSPSGVRVTRAIHWCTHPLCEMGETRWRLSTSPPEVRLVEWIPEWPPIAVAYLLLMFPLDALPRMEARIGICDQWTDRAAGNVPLPGEEPRLFTERYFAASGPGVYSAPILDRREDEDL